MIQIQKLRRKFTLLLAVVILVSTLIPLLQSSSVLAAGYKDLTVRKQAEIWVLSRAVAECVKERGFEDGNKSESDIREGKWLNGQVGADDPVNVGEWSADLSEGKSDDSQVKCVPAAKTVLAAMGVDAVQALCSMNRLAGKDIWQRSGGGGDCLNGANDLDFDENDNGKNDTDIWNRFVREYMQTDSIESSLTRGMRYVIYSENFYQECSNDHGANWGSPREWRSSDKESDKVYKIKWNLSREDNNPAGADSDWYVVSGGNGRDHEVHIDGYGLLDSNDKATCNDLADRINDHASAYLAEVRSDANSDASSGGSTNNGNNSNSDPSCLSEAGALSWITCPVLFAIDSVIGFLDQTINNVLFIEQTTYGNQNIDAAWSVMRNVALLILVPMMIFMVIGTALNFGPFDPYTVKKALPRMFVATIFIVISLPITRFGVELSNVVGQGIGNIIISSSPSNIQSLGDIFADVNQGASGEGVLFGAAVAGFVGAGLAGTVTIGILFSFALVTFVGLLIGFLILILRQVLIIMLMVLAPLAILAWIFPGNDKLWGIWRTTFIAMLMMYPIIAALIASGRFVAGIVQF